MICQRSSVVEQRFRKPDIILKSVNKFTVSELALLTNFSKSYISQVKSGKKPPSQKFIYAIVEKLHPKKAEIDYYKLFIQSRLAKEVSPTTIGFYDCKLGRFLAEINPDKAKQQHIERFLLQFKNAGNRQRYFQVIKTFYIWREQLFGLPNPIRYMPAPKVPKLILPSLNQGQVNQLIDIASSIRDKTIIALFTESGLRLSELAAIKRDDINWDSMTIRVFGKGKKEAYAPFGQKSKEYLLDWLNQNNSNGNIWGITKWGIVLMLKRLEKTSGILCHPHVFRRTFATLLRKAGVDSLTIKELGRWNSVQMVERYTRSFSFEDSMKFYKPPLS